MRRGFRFFSSLPLVFVALSFASVRAQTEVQTLEATHLWRFCAECHGDGAAKGKFRLEDLHGRSESGIRDLHRALDQAASEFMPPPGGEMPTLEERKEIKRQLREMLPRKVEPLRAGPVTLRRLNRAELRAAFRLILGIPVEVQAHMSKDAAAYGFDRVGDVQYFSPELYESCLNMARAAIQAAQKDERGRRALYGDSEEPLTLKGVRAFVERIMLMTFRTPPRGDEVERRLEIYEQGRWGGQSHELAMDGVWESLLSSPRFLFVVEAGGPANARGQAALTDFELVTRLSLFLWSSPPTQDLLKHAGTGLLRDTASLRELVREMLEAPEAEALAHNFAAQWLGFREILTISVDVRRFKFSKDLRRGFYQESVKQFDHLLRTNGSAVELLDADYAWLNEPLAKHYGIKGVSGRAFRKVKLDDRRRGGVLGTGSVLTLTSFPLRTSPVVRGKWVLERLLGASPPPPPPNAGILPEDDKQKDGLTLRERLEQHRDNPACASCHARMDPFGLVLEAYDGIGAWRDAAHGTPLDLSVELPGGVSAKTPSDLKDYLLARRDRFARTLVSNLLIYALGRPVERYDDPVIKSILDRTRDRDYPLADLIAEIVLSFPFRHLEK